MGIPGENDRRERATHLICVAGSVIGAAWGIQWIFRVGGLNGETLVQLLFSFLMTLTFALRAAGRNRQRFHWVNTAFLCGLWVWRSSFKHVPLGVVTFSILAGLSLVGLLLTSGRARA